MFIATSTVWPWRCRPPTRWNHNVTLSLGRSSYMKNLQGTLGLFHCIQRITKTLKKKHCNRFVAINGLLNCMYQYHATDYENLLQALKQGTLSTKHTDEDIADLKASRLFRQRYHKYLRKEIRPPNVMCSMLDDWFDQFQCKASNPETRLARGWYDPLTGETLFSSETKEAIRNAKLNAPYLQDWLPLHQMYLVIQPSPNSPHQPLSTSHPMANQALSPSI